MFYLKGIMKKVMQIGGAGLAAVLLLVIGVPDSEQKEEEETAIQEVLLVANQIAEEESITGQRKLNKKKPRKGKGQNKKNKRTRAARRAKRMARRTDQRLAAHSNSGDLVFYSPSNNKRD